MNGPLRALAAALCLVACADDTRAPLSCADCPSGACDLALCFPPSFPKNLERVEFEIVPPEGSRYGRTQLSVEVGRTEAEFQLAPAREFAPVVVLDPNDQPIAARISVLSDQAIRNRALEASLLVRPDQPGRVKLTPGTYSVRVVPVDETIPGVEVTGWVVRGGAEITRKEFRLPAPEDRAALTGVVFDDETLEPLAEITVRAFSDRSRLASTSAETGPDGRFRLLLPQTSELQFQLVAERTRETPSFRFEQLVGLAAREIQVPLGPSSAESGLLALTLEGEGEGGPEPVEGAQLTLTASTSNPGRQLTLSATTNARGLAVLRSGELTVLPGRYVLTVQTPVGSPFQGLVTPLDLREVRPGRRVERKFALPPRIAVSGRVTSPNNEALGGVQLDFEHESSGRLWSFSAGTDGRYQAELDPGAYLVRLIAPPPEPGRVNLPVTLYALSVPDRVSIELAPLRLEAGVAFEGRLRGEENERIEGAEVSAYLRFSERTWAVGAAESDREGRFSLRLPDLASEP